MGDVFDEIAGNSSSEPDIFDHIAANVPAPAASAPEGAPGVFSTLFSQAKNIPGLLWQGAKSIPSALSAVANLPQDIGTAAIDAASMGREALFGSQFTPLGTNETYDRLNNTVRGVGSTAAALAGGTVGALGGLGGSAAGAATAMKGFDYLNQATGSDAITTGQQDLADISQNTMLGLATAGLVKSAGAAAKGASRVLTAAADTAPADEALLNSFGATKANAGEVLPALQSLQDRGLIASSESANPFQTTHANLNSAINSAVSDISSELDKTDGLTTKDLLPKGDEFNPGNMGVKTGSALRAGNQVLSTYKEGIIKTALSKDFPEANPQALYDDYKATLKAVDSPDSAVAKLAKEKISYLNDQIANAKWSGDDLWKLRQGLDKEINWDSAKTPARGEAAKVLRDNLQKKIVNLGGGPESPLATAFSDASDLLDAKSVGGGLVEKMANAEKLGEFRPAPIAKRIGSALISPVRTAFNAIGVGDPAVPSALENLSQLQGNSIPQVINRAGDRASAIASMFAAPTAAAALASNNNPVTSTDLHNLLSGLITKPVTAPTVLSAKRIAPLDEVKKQIAADPYTAAVYEMESSNNPNAVNQDKGEKHSSAKGGFQFIDSTAKSLGLKDPFDLGQSLQAFNTLTADYRKKFGNNPAVLYAAHVLGEGVMNKISKKQPLTDKEQKHLDDLMAVMPRFARIYQSKVGA